MSRRPPRGLAPHLRYRSRLRQACGVDYTIDNHTINAPIHGENGMDKVIATPAEAVADIRDGATIAIAGFSVGHRFATSLILALRDRGTKELCLVCNSLGDP